jgi:predicted nucleotidyltransferase
MGEEAMTKSLSALLAPPTEGDVQAALHRFEAALRDRFGTDLSRVLLFGSRARGDARPDSDVDIAVIFQRLPETGASVASELGEIAYAPLVDLGVEIAPIAVTESELNDPSRSTNPALIHALLREGVEVRPS